MGIVYGVGSEFEGGASEVEAFCVLEPTITSGVSSEGECGHFVAYPKP